MSQLESEKMLKCTVTPYKPAGSALAASFSELNQFLKGLHSTLSFIIFCFINYHFNISVLLIIFSKWKS